MCRKLAPSDEHFVTRPPINAGRNRSETRTRTGGHGDFIGASADQRGRFLTYAVWKVEIRSVRQLIRSLLPFQRNLRRASCCQRHRSLKRGVQISHAFEIGKLMAVIGCQTSTSLAKSYPVQGLVESTAEPRACDKLDCNVAAAKNAREDREKWRGSITFRCRSRAPIFPVPRWRNME